jgi:hypothetical protein
MKNLNAFYLFLWVGGLGLATVLACTAAQRKTANDVLMVSVDACVAAAKAAGRTDVANACGITDSALHAITTAMQTPEGAICTVPQDAGTQ